LLRQASDTSHLPLESVTGAKVLSTSDYQPTAYKPVRRRYREGKFGGNLPSCRHPPQGTLFQLDQTPCPQSQPKTLNKHGRIGVRGDFKEKEDVERRKRIDFGGNRVGPKQEKGNSTCGPTSMLAIFISS